MVDFHQAKAINNHYQIGASFGRLKEAIEIAPLFDNDLLAAILILEANALAISVGKNLPPEQQLGARIRWNIAYGIDHAARLRDRFPPFIYE